MTLFFVMQQKCAYGIEICSGTEAFRTQWLEWMREALHAAFYPLLLAVSCASSYCRQMCTLHLELGCVDDDDKMCKSHCMLLDPPPINLLCGKYYSMCFWHSRFQYRPGQFPRGEPCPLSQAWYKYHTWRSGQASPLFHPQR